MGDYGVVYLVNFMQILPPSSILEYFQICSFLFFTGHYWFLKFLKMFFGMRMGDLGGVYLVTFIQILPSSALIMQVPIK